MSIYPLELRHSKRSCLDVRHRPLLQKVQMRYREPVAVDRRNERAPILLFTSLLDPCMVKLNPESIIVPLRRLHSRYRRMQGIRCVRKAGQPWAKAICEMRAVNARTNSRERRCAPKTRGTAGTGTAGVSLSLVIAPRNQRGAAHGLPDYWPWCWVPALPTLPSRIRLLNLNSSEGTQ